MVVAPVQLVAQGQAAQVVEQVAHPSREVVVGRCLQEQVGLVPQEQVAQILLVQQGALPEVVQ